VSSASFCCRTIGLRGRGLPFGNTGLVCGNGLIAAILEMGTVMLAAGADFDERCAVVS
jgi:hypothetical protein